MSLQKPESVCTLSADRNSIAQSQLKWLKSNNSNTRKQNGSTKEKEATPFFTCSIT